jgi:hypothetical protein
LKGGCAKINLVKDIGVGGVVEKDPLVDVNGPAGGEPPKQDSCGSRSVRTYSVPIAFASASSRFLL